MSNIAAVFSVVATIVGSYVLLVAAINIFSFLRVRREPATNAGKMVSVLIPARNEAATIEACLKGLLEQ
ncbi:MAG: hypothetical protein ACOC0O_03125, partial [Spirochaetota bacterium]